jgi:ABC-type transport system involved in Fe-S cluster assembly fused permease/ATPase subunit
MNSEYRYNVFMALSGLLLPCDVYLYSWHHLSDMTVHYCTLHLMLCPGSVQSLIMFMGASSGLLVCVAGVQRGELTVGDTVLYMALMAQLYQPLSFFGSNYRCKSQFGTYELLLILLLLIQNTNDAS